MECGSGGVPGGADVESKPGDCVMRIVLLAIPVVLAVSAAAAVAPDQGALLEVASRFARTATHDPAYNEVLAAYCQRVRARIEGLPGDDDHRVVDRGAFGPSSFALGGSCARVGHGWWPENYEETHVLDDGPFWSVRTEGGVLLCGVSRTPPPTVVTAGFHFAAL